MAAETVQVLAGDLPGVKLVSSTGATSEVYKHGAHVASWKTGQGDDIIFLSSEVRFFSLSLLFAHRRKKNDRAWEGGG